MRLSELVDILKNTELSQIHLGENDDKVLSLLNLALIDVYSRFAILQEEQIINVINGVTRYRLNDNSQKVLQVYMRDPQVIAGSGYDDYQEVSINDINDIESVFTPTPHILHIPNPEEGRVYSVMQLVSPPYITKSNIDTIDFIVPPQLMEPIVNYVAYRAYKSMNGDEKSEIGSHYRAYTESCKEVLRRGLLNMSQTTNIKLDERGY